jgi:hypothetical protein
VREREDTNRTREAGSRDEVEGVVANTLKLLRNGTVGFIDWLGVASCQCGEQISYGKQRETDNSTPEIEIMTRAMLVPPTHPRKQVKCLTHMSKGDHHETSCTQQLEQSPQRLFPGEQDD